MLAAIGVCFSYFTLAAWISHRLISISGSVTGSIARSLCGSWGMCTILHGVDFYQLAHLGRHDIGISYVWIENGICRQTQLLVKNFT